MLLGAPTAPLTGDGMVRVVGPQPPPSRSVRPRRALMNQALLGAALLRTFQRAGAFKRGSFAPPRPRWTLQGGCPPGWTVRTWWGSWSRTHRRVGVSPVKGCPWRSFSLSLGLDHAQPKAVSSAAVRVVLPRPSSCGVSAAGSLSGKWGFSAFARRFLQGGQQWFGL